MKKMFLVTVMASAVSVGFGGEFEDCVKDCKAKNVSDALADYKCPNEVCHHLDPKFRDSTKIKGGGGIDTTSIKGDFTGNHAKSSGGAVK